MQSRPWVDSSEDEVTSAKPLHCPCQSLDAVAIHWDRDMPGNVLICAAAGPTAGEIPLQSFTHTVSGCRCQISFSRQGRDSLQAGNQAYWHSAIAPAQSFSACRDPHHSPACLPSLHTHLRLHSRGHQDAEEPLSTDMPDVVVPASMPCAAGRWLHVHPAALCLEMLRSEHFFRKGYPVNINSNPVRSCQPARGHGRSGCQ